MDISERKKLRIDLLKELYNIYFESSGNINGKDVDNSTIDKENKLAYQYLLNKNLIVDARIGGSTPRYTITTYGIDIVESLEENN